MTSILGISAFYHDSAAALIIDGKIIAAAQEERFSRKKHDSSYPFHSIEFVLKESKLKLSEVDYVVFYEKPFLKFERLLETYLAFAPKGFKSFSMSMPIWLREKLFQKKILFDELKNHDINFNDINKIYFSEHHFSHAASAFYPSPFKKAIILTLDGVGEWATTTVAKGDGSDLEILKEIHFPHSIGLLYSAFTYYTGFKVNSGEYKLMGLAPYGEPKYKDLILNNLIDVKEDGTFSLDQNFFNYSTGLTMTNENFSNLFGQKPRDSKKEKLIQFHMDIAASIQKVTEEIMLTLARSLKKEFSIPNLCLAGGVALNCVANGKILENKIFEKIWIQPAAGDAGGSLGAALVLWHKELNKEREISKTDNMQGSYLGPEYSQSKIEDILSNLGAKFEVIDEENLINKTKLLRNSLKNASIISSSNKLEAVRLLRVTKTGFADDGPQRASDVIEHCESDLDDSMIPLFKKAILWKKSSPLDFLNQLKKVKKELLIRYTPKPFYKINKPRADIIEIIAQVQEQLKNQLGDRLPSMLLH